ACEPHASGAPARGTDRAERRPPDDPEPAGAACDGGVPVQLPACGKSSGRVNLRLRPAQVATDSPSAESWLVWWDDYRVAVLNVQLAYCRCRSTAPAGDQAG